MGMARLVFVMCDEHPGFEQAARVAFPGAEFKPRAFHPNGPTAYVALSDDQLDKYDAWFSGVGVRARARIRDRALARGSALLLPVTYESWAVVVDGPSALGAALEGVANLAVRAVVCPAFAPNAVQGAANSLSLTYCRWQDRVMVCDPTLKNNS